MISVLRFLGSVVLVMAMGTAYVYGLAWIQEVFRGDAEGAAFFIICTGFILGMFVLLVDLMRDDRR
jgi:hypothetical protein